MAVLVIFKWSSYCLPFPSVLLATQATAGFPVTPKHRVWFKAHLSLSRANQHMCTVGSGGGVCSDIHMNGIFISRGPVGCFCGPLMIPPSKFQTPVKAEIWSYNLVSSMAEGMVLSPKWQVFSQRSQPYLRFAEPKAFLSPVWRSRCAMEKSANDQFGDQNTEVCLPSVTGWNICPRNIFKHGKYIKRSFLVLEVFSLCKNLCQII